MQETTKQRRQVTPKKRPTFLYADGTPHVMLRLCIPQELVEQLERYAIDNRMSCSAAAKKAFRELLQKRNEAE